MDLAAAAPKQRYECLRLAGRNLSQQFFIRFGIR
jgi:hypothetical protein